MINYKIYCTYHNEQLITDYQLKENKHFKLYNVNDIINNDISLNYANKYFNEYVTQYYVWKNNIYSDYIGFCHYRRIFNDINLNKLKNGYIQGIEIYNTPAINLYHDLNYCGFGYYIDLLIDYVNEYYNNYINNLIDVLFTANKYNNKLIRECYICNWEIFNNMMIFIEKFLKIKIFDNNDLDHITLDQYQYIINKLSTQQWDYREIYFKTYNIPSTIEGCFGDRCLSFFIEQLINIYFQIFYSNKIFN